MDGITSPSYGIRLPTFSIDHGKLNFSIRDQSISVLFKNVGLAIDDGLVMAVRGWESEPLLNLYIT